ncbi:radical SAM protein [bacterium]|nr:radical SAM protein [bacterium]
MNSNSLWQLPKRTTKWILRNTRYRRAVYRPRPEHKPFLVRLDINNTCNMACSKCFYPDYARQNPPKCYMSVEDFRLLASRLLDYTYCLHLACAYESLLHPDYVEILAIADEYDLPYMGMVTNGSLLEGDKAKAIARSPNMRAVSVSLDALDPEIFAKIRGRPMLDRVLKNLEDFQELRHQAGDGAPAVNINIRIMRSNLDDLPQMVDLCHRLDIHNAQFFHVAPFSADNEESVFHEPNNFNSARKETIARAESLDLELRMPPALPENIQEEESISADLLEAGIVTRRKKEEGEKPLPQEDFPFPYPTDVHCICPWMTLAIDYRGDITPCAHRYDYVIGNLLRQDLFDAINSIRLLKLRQAMLDGRHHEFCPACQPHTTPYGDPTRERLPDIL